ncbi:MAG: hypothetical protein M3238_06800 [Actinomycetota bacterium]|nr:hypothetical protein [Actinomycetota bacterium]
MRAVAAVLCVIALAACGPDGDGEPRADDTGDADELIVQAANFDLAAGEKTRFMAGVLTPDQLFVSYGTVDMKFFYLGTKEGSGTAQPGPTETGRFLAIEGSGATEGPIAAPASRGRGVYAAQVTFDRAGFWAVELTAELDGAARTGQSVFEVFEEHRIPTVGDRALRTDNRTLSSDVPRQALDSRARTSGEIPDAALHRTTIADSIRAREPALVVLSTPVYCQSRFCGPVTDMVAGLQKDYGDRANFIHIEIWFNFQRQEVNKAAAEWLFRKGDLTEPWIFLIGDDGRIVARWDNVALREEIEPFLRELPRL